MFDVQRFINKFKKFIPTDDIIKILEKLPNDPKLNQISSNAGTIGSVINIILHLTEKVYESKVSAEKRLSLTLMRIMLESAKDSLPYSIIDIKFDDLFNENKKSEEFENIIFDLFNPNYNNISNKDNQPREFLDHPVFNNFRNLLDEGIKNINRKYKLNIDSARFLTEFNSNLLLRLEEEKTNNNDLENLLHKWQINNDFEKLSNFLKNSRRLFYEVNKIDDKSLSEYYIENQTFIVDKDTWEIDEDLIVDRKVWSILSFLKSNKSIEIIAAPFGIGKSSLAKKIAYDCATKFIENPINQNNYLPIFVPLKFSLETTNNENSLSNDLTKIASISSKHEKTNVLIILDGLDELPTDRPINIYNIYTTIQDFINNYPNTKFIITTRLESGFPNRLNIKDTYVRLFSFTENQIKEFFHYYDLSHDYYKISKILDEKKLGKPLFCWMAATVFKRSTDQEREILFNYSANDNIGEIYLYQQFIHNIIFGKPKVIAEKEFKIWAEKAIDEKKALRLIAFLKHDRPFISKNKIIDYLESLKFNLPKDATSLISTYFSTSLDDQGKEKFEFIHKSFQEYLLAEFYIESVVTENFHRLIGSEPTKETYYFINGLLKLLNHDNKKIQAFGDQISESILPSLTDKSEFINALRSNSLKFVSQKSILSDITRIELEIWNYHNLEYTDLSKIWAARWLGIYIAGNLLPSKKFDSITNFQDSASFFIKNNSFLHNKILHSLTLSFENFPIEIKNADFSNADLSYSDFSYADLSSANFSDTDLSGTNFSNAKLENTKFYDSSRITIGGLFLDALNVVPSFEIPKILPNPLEVPFSGILPSINMEQLSDQIILDRNDLFSLQATISAVRVHATNFSNTNLKNAEFIKTEFINSDFSYSNLSGANLSNADLSFTKFIGSLIIDTRLDNTNIEYANFSDSFIDPKSFEGLKINKHTNFTNAITTNSSFINYLKKNTSYSLLPKLVTSEEFEIQLKNTKYNFQKTS